MDIDWRKENNAPEPGTRVCHIDDIKPGIVSEFGFGSAEPFRMILYRSQDNIFAYVNQCPHHWIPMNQKGNEFRMWDTEAHEMMCIHHCAIFQLTEGGRCIDGPCKGSNLTVIPVQIVDKHIIIAGS